MWTLKLSIAYLLAASAVGTMSFIGCTTTEPTTRDDDDGDDDDDDVADAGKKADAGAKADAGKTDAGKKGDAGLNIDVTGDAGPAVEACPTGLSCGALNLPVQVPVSGIPAALCLEGATPPQCPDSKDCGEIDLPGAQCVSVDFSGIMFSFCVQECVSEDGRDVDAGKTDAGKTDAGKADAGRATDAGKADAGRDAGRDAG